MHACMNAWMQMSMYHDRMRADMNASCPDMNASMQIMHQSRCQCIWGQMSMQPCRHQCTHRHTEADTQRYQCINANIYASWHTEAVDEGRYQCIMSHNGHINESCHTIAMSISHVSAHIRTHPILHDSFCIKETHLSSHRSVETCVCRAIELFLCNNWDSYNCLSSMTETVINVSLQ